MQTSSPARPCPCCGRTRDSDCRWNDTTILCHQGQSHGPPSHLKRGDTINIGGKQWAVIRFDGGFAGCAMVLKPHRGKARSRAYSRLLGGTAPPMDKVGRLAAEEIEKAIADIDRVLAVPPFEFLRPDEMRRDFALALETYEATNAFRKTVGKLARSRPCLRERKAVLDCALKTLWWMCRAVEEFRRNELGECNQFGEPIACRPSKETGHG